MRFRAKLQNLANIIQLTKVLTSLLKSVKQCVLRLTEDKVSLVAAENGVLGGVHLWCDIDKNTFFEDYRLEGREGCREVYMEVGLEQLVRAFRSAHSAAVVRLRLARKEGAILAVEILQPTAFSTQRQLVHEVPVLLLPQRLWCDYHEPKMPDIDVSLYLPALRPLKAHVDRMKNLSSHLYISANWSGELRLRVDTETVAVDVNYSNLRNHLFDTACDRDDLGFMFETRVNAKKFSQLLSSQMAANKVICNIVQEKGIQLFLLQDEVSIMYYLPSVNR